MYGNHTNDHLVATRQVPWQQLSLHNHIVHCGRVVFGWQLTPPMCVSDTLLKLDDEESAAGAAVLSPSPLLLARYLGSIAAVANGTTL